MKHISRKSHDVQVSSSSEYQEQIQDKLNDLWSQMKQRKNQIIKSVVPSYYRKEVNDDNSFINITSQHQDKNEQSEILQQLEARLKSSQKQVLKLRNRLSMQINNNKVKDAEITQLKQRINQILNEKKSFLKDKQSRRRFDSTKINIVENERFDREKQNKNYQTSFINESSIVDKSIIDIEKPYTEGIKGDTQRLLELLRSTQQYKQFVFYHNNNELSFLRNLGRMRRKNCACNLSQRQKTLWAPKDVLEIMKSLNTKDNMGLDDQMIQRIVYNLNLLYLQRQKVKLQDLKIIYEKKVKLLQRKADSNIPYDIVQIQRQKQRQLLKTKVRSKSTVRR